MTTRPDDQQEDDEYLWSGQGPVDPAVSSLEGALGSLKSKRSFDPKQLPELNVAARENVVRPARWRRAAWLLPVAAAAAAALWWIGRTPSPEIVSLDGSASGAPSGEPAPAATNMAAGSVASSALPTTTCNKDSDGPGLAFELIAGEPARCGEGAAPKLGKLPTGVWLTTPKGTRVRMVVATLGQVDVEPESRLRVLATSDKEHRLELARGAIHAVIDAPPRLFFVQTRSAIAIDLGCEYTLAVDDLGNGRLSVKTGFVELAVPAPTGQSPLSSLVPKGASAALIDGRGPGLPVWDREPEAVKSAAGRVDANPADAQALDALLEGLGSRDTLTLVHLLPRVTRDGREKVMARLAAIEPLAAELRARAVDGDAEALRGVRAQFEPRWFPKPINRLRR